jgi:hypothetical protein
MRLGRRGGAQRSQIARNPMFGLTPGIFNRSMHAAIATTLPGADRVTKSAGRNVSKGIPAPWQKRVRRSSSRTRAAHSGCFHNLLLVTRPYLRLTKALIPDFRVNQNR